MTVEEFIAELEHWKREARLYKAQMEVNNDYCQCYANALISIAKMCGWEQPTGGFTGTPENLDAMVLRIVSDRLKKETP